VIVLQGPDYKVAQLLYKERIVALQRERESARAREREVLFAVGCWVVSVGGLFTLRRGFSLRLAGYGGSGFS